MADAPAQPVTLLSRTPFMPRGVGGCFSSIGGIGLVEDAGDMVGYCSETENQFFSDISVTFAPGNEAQHFHLPLG